MNFVPQQTGDSSPAMLTEDCGGSQQCARLFYPARKVTGEHLKAMGLEFIRPDAIASKWRTIHNHKIGK